MAAASVSRARQDYNAVVTTSSAMSILLLCTGRIHGGSHSTSRFLSSTHPHHNHNGALEKEHARLKRRGGLPGPLLDVCGPRSRVWRKATPPLFAHTLGSVSSVRHTSNNVGQRATSQHRSHWDKIQHTSTLAPLTSKLAASKSRQKLVQDGLSITARNHTPDDTSSPLHRSFSARSQSRGVPRYGR